MTDYDRIKSSLMALLLDVLDRTDYHALYPCLVVKQNADKTLELKPDSAKIPPMSKVPIRLGIPGASVTLEDGARVLLGFAGGDPKRPIATLWEASSIDVLTLNAGDKKVAVVGSVTVGHSHSYVLMAGPSPVTGTIASATDTIANGTPILKAPEAG